MAKRVYSETEILEKIKRRPSYISKVEQTPERAMLAVNTDFRSIQLIDEQHRDFQVCMIAVQHDYHMLQYVPVELMCKELLSVALAKSGLSLGYIPEKLRTISICEKAVEKTPGSIRYVPEELRTDQLIEAAVARDWKVAAYAPEYMLTLEFCAEIYERAIQSGKTLENSTLRKIVARFPEDIRNSPIIRRLEYSNGIRRIISKKYRTSDAAFIVEERLTGIADPFSVFFSSFIEFAEYLFNDISDADLLEYDFDGVNIRNYNWEQALISSDVLFQYGLYDDPFYSSIKQAHSASEAAMMPIGDSEYEAELICHAESLDEKLQDTTWRMYYISDIHLDEKVLKRYPIRASKEEVCLYVDRFVEKMVRSIGTRTRDSYIVIAGDVAHSYVLTELFYEALVKHWWYEWNIIAVLGNHELWDTPTDPDSIMAVDASVSRYRKLFKRLGIRFLNNQLFVLQDGVARKISSNRLLEMSAGELREWCRKSRLLVLGGIGFSGLNPEFNAKHGLYGAAITTHEEDIIRTREFEQIYEKVHAALHDQEVIVVTHTPKENWTAAAYNPRWIYVNGHTHRNHYICTEEKRVYSDNQVGYTHENVQLKWFEHSYAYDIFADYADGIYSITADQYIDFYNGIGTRIQFSRKDETIWMLKRQGFYCFIYQDAVSAKLSLLNGGARKKLEHQDIQYYYENMLMYIYGTRKVFERYHAALRRISKAVKNLGGCGTIHGCIVDIDFLDHIYLDLQTGELVPYFAFDMIEKYPFGSVEQLLKARRPDLLQNYQKILSDDHENALILQQSVVAVDDAIRYVPETHMYRPSRIMRSIQYMMDINIIRIWSDEVVRRGQELIQAENTMATGIEGYLSESC